MTPTPWAMQIVVRVEKNPSPAHSDVLRAAGSAVAVALDAFTGADADLSHFEYFLLAMLSESPERTLRMTALAVRTNATLPRLSHVVRRLEDRGLVERFPCPEDGRATNARLTEDGWAKVVETAPGHVATVREHVIDALTPKQTAQLADIAGAILERIDPDGAMSPR